MTPGVNFIWLLRYSLAQEHGDLINLHEWFHSFKSIVSLPPLQAKRRARASPSPKKRKNSNEPQNRNDAKIQYPLLFVFLVLFQLFSSTYLSDFFINMDGYLHFSAYEC